MEVDAALERLGGVTSYGELARLVGRRAIELAQESGQVERVGRGRYALPAVSEAHRIAHGLSGTLSHTSAALHWGWGVRAVPEIPHVTLPRHRKPSTDLHARCVPHWSDLSEVEVSGGVTSVQRTLIDCLRSLPEADALVVADSALREQVTTHADLNALIAPLRGPGVAQARRVARRADGRACNAFESALRAICLGVPGLAVTPQVEITDRGFFAQPDLVDRRLRIVIEAESQRWHNAERSQLRRDCKRYTALVSRGWLVVRFAWEDVMFHPAYVREELVRLVALAQELAELRSQRRRSA